MNLQGQGGGLTLMRAALGLALVELFPAAAGLFLEIAPDQGTAITGRKRGALR